MTESKIGGPEKDPGFVDYSVIYKQKELKQLNKRLRKTRNILLIASLAFLVGGMVFRLLPEAAFSMQSLLFYIVMALLLACIAFLSNRKPYRFLLFGLIICIASWGGELLLGNTDNFLIEATIHKLAILSLLISGLHASKEAELIKKELQFT